MTGILFLKNFLYCSTVPSGVFLKSRILAEIQRYSTPSKTECAGFLVWFGFCYMIIITPRMAINTFCILTTLTQEHLKYFYISK